MKLESPSPAPMPPYTTLAVAIVERACQDYAMARYARLRFPEEPGSDRLSRMEVNCIEFFKNQNHPAWMSIKIGSDQLIQALNKMVVRCIKEGRAPKLNGFNYAPRRVLAEDVSDEETERFY